MAKRKDKEVTLFKPEWGFHNFMVTAAHRYSLGRRTYAVSLCVDWLMKYWDEIDHNSKRLIVSETREAIDRGCAGDSCDIECWEGLLKFVEGKK